MARKVKNTITNQKDQKDLLMLVARIKQTFQKVFDEDKCLTKNMYVISSPEYQYLQLFL